MVDDRHGEVLAVAIFFAILSWVSVSLRIYTRAAILKSVGVDDWMVILAQLIFSAYLVCQLGGVAHGTGRHHRDLPLPHATQALEYWWFCELFYVQATCFAKLAVALFLLRLAVKRYYQWLLYAIMVADVVICQSFFFIVLCQCSPMSLFWRRIDPAQKGGQCLNANMIVIITYVASALNAVADWVLAILPIFMLKEVQMLKHTKYLVMGVLALGAIASVATLARMPYLRHLANIDDFLYATTDVAIWSTVEPGLGISATSLATLRPLLRSILGRRFDETGQLLPIDSKLGAYSSSNNAWCQTGDGHADGHNEHDMHHITSQTRVEGDSQRPRSKEMMLDSIRVDRSISVWSDDRHAFIK